MWNSVNSRRAAATLAALLCAGSAPALAQDVAVASQVTGQPLPFGYIQRVTQRPDFFEIQRGWKNAALRAARRGQPLGGTLPIAIVLALHSDVPDPAVTPDEIQRILFDGPSTTGTLAEFYSEMSGGLLQIDGRVLPWVRTGLTVAEVRGTSFGLGADARTPEFLIQALTAADATTDFGQFDNDGPDGIPNSGDDDGFVDVLAVEFLESSITCSGNGPTIWAHRARISGWTDSPFTTNDVRPGGEPIYVDDYIIQAAVRCNGASQTITTIAHEMGHIIGLPDLYDRTEGILPVQRNWVEGCWSLMAAGTWGCGPALERGEWDRPTHLGPWEKNELGWLPNLQVVGAVQNQEFTLRPSETTGDALRVPLSPREYLLVEYRQGSGFNTRLPATGVLIHHVDLDRPLRRCRACPQLYRVALVEADANMGLITREGEGGNRGEAGDVFARNGPVQFSNATSPSTRLNSGAESPVTFYRIAVENGVATIRLSTTVVSLERLLEPFVANNATPLTSEDRDYLDSVGNDNGRYDIGDLRRYLQRHPSVGISNE